MARSDLCFCSWLWNTQNLSVALLPSEPLKFKVIHLLECGDAYKYEKKISVGNLKYVTDTMNKRSIFFAHFVQKCLSPINGHGKFAWH